MRDFFISYNKADLSWAEWIAWQLESAGNSTIIQAWDFRPGSNFVIDMQRAATEAERTIAYILSHPEVPAHNTKISWATLREILNADYPGVALRSMQRLGLLTDVLP